MSDLSASSKVAFATVWSVFAPPPNLTISQWADRERYLSPESSPEPGRWNTDRAEYLREVMDAACDPAVHTVVAMMASQTAKTECLNNIVGYHIDQDPAPILVLQPTLSMAETWSKDRLAPMLRDSPALTTKVSDPRSRDSGNTVLQKEFMGGRISIVGANSPSGLASRPIRIVLADEIDRYPLSAGSEGDPVTLASVRSRNFWNRKLVLTSTPTVKGESRIETAYDSSDQRKFWVPCPDCGEFQILKWAHVRWDKDEPDTAHYVCDHCGVLWPDARRWDAIRKGEWRADAEFKGIAGFWINSIYSSWVTLADLARAFIAAKPFPDLLRVFVNTSLAESWEEVGETLAPTAIDARRLPYGPDGLPEDVEFLTAGVDTQGDRLECEVVGWSRDERSWGVIYKVLPGDPAQDQVWADLDKLLFSTFQAGSRKLRIQAVAIDSGGHHAESVYRFCATRANRRVYAIKGQGGQGRPVWPLRSSKTNTNERVFIVGVDTAKDAVTARWNIETGPGSCAIPADPAIGYDGEWVEQMTAEQRLTRFKNGRPYKVWILPKGHRNEAFDCRVYAMAAMRCIYRGNAAGSVSVKPTGNPPARGRSVRSRGI